MKVSAGNQHSCALRESGAVACWGRNSYGQLGNGTRDDSTTPVAVLGLSDAVALSVGGDFSCARRKAGSVVCWGNNQDGQLGDGRGAKVGVWSTKPTGVAGLTEVREVAAGAAFACALRGNGSVACWGEGANGQIGSDAERAFARPRAISGVAKAVSVAVGSKHACAVEQGGRVMCWGRNSEGQLGDGAIASRINAKPVQGLSDAVSLVSGGSHTCALRKGGKVSCWGDGRDGQLGVGPGTDKVRTPRAVSGLAGMKKLVAGDEHTCAMFSATDVRCWGSNAEGQIDRSKRDQATPKKLDGVRGVVDIDAGHSHTCVVSGGKVYCWGSAERGALGPNPR